MQYFENAFRLRVPSTEIYDIHRRLDFYIQEGAMCKLGYSYLCMAGGANDSLILLRSPVALNLPGERKKEIFLKEGDSLSFSTTIVLVRREGERGAKREVPVPDDNLEDYIRIRLAMAGLDALSVTTGERRTELAVKPVGKKQHKIFLPVADIKVRACVTSVEKAENAFVYGIGRKRVFGYGYLSLEHSE